MKTECISANGLFEIMCERISTGQQKKNYDAGNIIYECFCWTKWDSRQHRWRGKREAETNLKTKTKKKKEKKQFNPFLP